MKMGTICQQNECGKQWKLRSFFFFFFFFEKKSCILMKDAENLPRRSSL